MKTLTENSYLSIGIVVLILSIAVWALRLESHVMADQKNLERIEAKVGQHSSEYHEIIQRLTRIEERLSNKR